MEEKISKMPPEKRKNYAFIKASAFINIDNLRPGWFEEMKEESPSDIIYDAEILNIRPKEILNGFLSACNSQELLL